MYVVSKRSAIGRCDAQQQSCASAPACGALGHLTDQAASLVKQLFAGCPTGPDGGKEADHSSSCSLKVHNFGRNPTAPCSPPTHTPSLLCKTPSGRPSASGPRPSTQPLWSCECRPPPRQKWRACVWVCAALDRPDRLLPYSAAFPAGPPSHPHQPALSSPHLPLPLPPPPEPRARRAKHQRGKIATFFLGSVTSYCTHHCTGEPSPPACLRHDWRRRGGTASAAP